MSNCCFNCCLISDFDFELSLINKSAGVSFSASAILIIMAKEGFAFPDSISPMVPVPQSQIIESCVCEIPLAKVTRRNDYYDAIENYQNRIFSLITHILSLAPFNISE